MTTATVGARYQVVIPAVEREKAGIRPHDKVSVEAVTEGILIRRVDQGQLRGLGRELSHQAEPVDYVRELREQWGDRQ